MTDPAANRGYADPEKDFQYWARQTEIIKRRASGQAVAQIASEMFPELVPGTGQQQVFRALKNAANDLRTRLHEFIEERFLLAVSRLDRIIKLLDRYLTDMESGLPFDDKPLRILLMVMDREARLLALDRTPDKGGSGAGRMQWIDGAPPQDIVDEARRLKIPEVERFQVPTE